MPLSSDLEYLEEELARWGLGREGAAFLERFRWSCLMLRGLGRREARLLRQRMHSLGGEVALSLHPLREEVNALLLGSPTRLWLLCQELWRDGLRHLAERLERCLRGQLHPPRLLLRGQELELRHALVMGILNVTPDSFSNGGRYLEPRQAVEHALWMAEQGADIVDVGGESTRPGAEPVPVEEELRRVIPVIEGIRAKSDVPISVDTYKAAVAREAIRAGADMVNDVSAGRFDPEMVEVVRSAGVPMVVMHMRGTPRTMQWDVRYRSLLGEVVGFLQERVEHLEQRGVDPRAIVVDPGLGFGKSVERDNLVLLKHLGELRALGKPILVGPSRKAFIGHVLGLPVEDREEGTAAAVAVAVMNGANIVRVHDVRRMKRVVKVVEAIQRARGY